MNIRKNDGITLAALGITIVLLLIISGITINTAIRGDKETEESVKIFELNTVQHAIYERYTKSQLTNETLPGTTVEISQVQNIISQMNSKSGESIQLKGTEYKRLNNSDLEILGITDAVDTYIVNYKTGEVINETTKVTENGKALYVYSKSE